MRIQCVGKINTQFESKHEITYTQFDKPFALDMFDVNVFSLQDNNLFRYKKSETHLLSCTNDLKSIRDMIINSQAAINIIAMPQDYCHVTSCDSQSYRTTIRLKDELDNLVSNILASIIPPVMSKSYQLLYENSGTMLRKSMFESSFCFKDISYGVVRLSETIGGCKPTVIQKDRIILTTLDLCTKDARFDDFIGGIGLDKEKTEIPEWLVHLDYFDDSIQKASITDSESRIVELNKQIEISKERLEDNLKYKSILVTNGKELVEVVFEMLEEMLDCSLEDFEDENIEDFLIKKPSVTFVGEIKGVTSNVKSEHVAQVDRHYQAYMDRLSEEGKTENVKSLLIMSPFRTKPLSERGEVHENQIHLAKRNGSLIITTDKFLKLYEMFTSGLIDSEKIVGVFSSKVGLLEDSDFISSSNTSDNSEYVIK